MKTTIFCFSGSGNSYWVAETLAAHLSDTTVVMIPTLLEARGIELGERVGFVYPVYKGFPPNLVTYFVEELLAGQNAEHVEYLFQISTCYLSPFWAQYAMESSLFKVGMGVSYTNRVKMADTFVPLFKTPDSDRIDRLYSEAEKKIATIAGEIEEGAIKIARSAPFAKIATRYMMKPVQRAMMDSAEGFAVTDACTGCGLCYRICPSENIEMRDGKPTWDRLCSSCLACYHRCPEQAITFKRRIRGGHYPNSRSGYTMEYRT